MKPHSLSLLVSKTCLALVVFGYLPIRSETIPDSGTVTPDLLANYASPQKGFGWLTRFIKSLGMAGSSTQQGNNAYRKKDYDQALQKYSEAVLDDPSSQILAYNTGNAEYQKKRYPEAIASFTKALQGKEGEIIQKAHYNMGNAYFRKGEASLTAGREEGISDYREALAHYKKSLEINSGNQNAKRNIEVVQARLKELLDKKEKNQQNKPSDQKPPEPSAKAKEALAKAMQLVQQRRYPEAKTVLEAILSEDPTAASYRSHLQRLDDVMKILQGEKPAPPAPQDPRSQQGGMGII